MNLKKLITTAFEAGIIMFSVNALGAGVQAGFFPALSMNQNGTTADTFEANITGTFRLLRLPVVMGSGIVAGVEDSQFSLGVSTFADWWAIDYQIENNWNLYSGFGISALLCFSSEKITLTTGPRFFVGMNWIFTDHFLELYIQQNAVPSMCLNFAADSRQFKLFLPFESGVRFHF